MLLLPEGQMSEAWEAEKNMLCEWKIGKIIKGEAKHKNIRGLNFAEVKLTTVQLTNLQLYAVPAEEDTAWSALQTLD